MDIDLMNWQGLSARDYEFWVYKLDHEFKQVGAVFIYVRPKGDSLFEIVYVNQTDRMDMVARNPIADNIIAEYQPTSIQMLLSHDMSERKGIMADLFMRYRPVGNYGNT